MAKQKWKFWINVWKLLGRANGIDVDSAAPKDCPNNFCDGKETKEGLEYRFEPNSNNPGQIKIICLWCGLEGPYGTTMREALSLWNSLPRSKDETNTKPQD